MPASGAADTVIAMSVTEDAPAPPLARRSPLHMPGRARRASPWWWLVLVSSALLLTALAVLAVWWAASRETRVAQYRVLGTVSAIQLDVGTADVEIVGGASTAVEVRRTAEFAFGHPPDQTRRIAGDVLQITSRCPDTVIGTCEASYRIGVRDNVQVNVLTTSGRVRVSGLNGSARIQTGSGAITVDGFCGFQLSATSASGDVGGGAACSPDRMNLRSSQRRRPRDRADRPLPRRRQQLARRRPGSQPDRDRRRPVRRPGHQRHRRRARGGPRMTAIRASRGLELPRHLRAAGRTLLYLLLGLPYGITYLVVVGGGLLLGAVLSIAWIGLPLLAAVARLVWQLAEGERRTANRWLAAHLPPVPRAPRGDWRNVLEATGHRPFWRALGMLLLRLPVALVGLLVVSLRSRSPSGCSCSPPTASSRAATASSGRGRSAPESRSR